MTERTKGAGARIVRAAAELLTHGGLEAVSTRAVSAAAGVQPPAIYREYKDMQGLLHAAARAVLARYVRQKASRAPGPDPLEDLRRGWDLHVSFGLANPAAYTLLYGPAAASEDDAAHREGIAVLHALLRRVAEAGHLKVSIEHAARMIHAGGMGVTCSLIATPLAERDLRVSDEMRDAIVAAITEPTKSAKAKGVASVAARAVSLRASLAETGDALSTGERQLLGEWLDRIADVRVRGSGR